MIPGPPVEARRGRVQTVAGLVEATALGRTMMHEHLMIDLNLPRIRAEAVDPTDTLELCNCFAVRWGTQYSRRNFQLDDRELATSELRRFAEAGGGTLVELTAGGLKPDPLALRAIAAASGVHVVMGCGHYVQEYQDEANAGCSADDFAREIVDQVTKGAWGTDVCAGIIGEIGCQAPWTVGERRVMQGALLAQAETGAAVNVHPGRDRTSRPRSPPLPVPRVRRWTG